MKRLKYLIPTFILFLSPWFSYAVAKNLMIVWPDIGMEGARNVALGGCAVAGFVTLMLVSGAFD